MESRLLQSVTQMFTVSYMKHGLLVETMLWNIRKHKREVLDPDLTWCLMKDRRFWPSMRGFMNQNLSDVLVWTLLVWGTISWAPNTVGVLKKANNVQTGLNYIWDHFYYCFHSSSSLKVNEADISQAICEHLEMHSFNQ